MLHRLQIPVDAPADRVWRVVHDVIAWPGLTASMTSVELQGELTVGAEVRLTQPQLRPASWRVTELEEGSSFTWVSGVPGVRTTAVHRVRPSGDGAVLELELSQTGLLSGLVERKYGDLMRSYVRMEAEGIKATAEAT